MLQPKLDVLPPSQRVLWPKLVQIPEHFNFQGGDLEQLPEKTRRDLEAAVQTVKAVPTFAGTKQTIGWMP